MARRKVQFHGNTGSDRDLRCVHLVYAFGSQGRETFDCGIPPPEPDDAQSCPSSYKCRSRFEHHAAFDRLKAPKPAPSFHGCFQPDTSEKVARQSREGPGAGKGASSRAKEVHPERILFRPNASLCPVLRPIPRFAFSRATQAAPARICPPLLHIHQAGCREVRRRF